MVWPCHQAAEPQGFKILEKVRQTVTFPQTGKSWNRTVQSSPFQQTAAPSPRGPQISLEREDIGGTSSVLASLLRSTTKEQVCHSSHWNLPFTARQWPGVLTVAPLPSTNTSSPQSSARSGSPAPAHAASLSSQPCWVFVSRVDGKLSGAVTMT